MNPHAVLLGILALASLPSAQDIGVRGPGYDGALSSPTGSKPESKLWHADDSWWAALWNPLAQSHTIHRLEAGTESWIDTGVAIDARPDSNSDVLWNGAKLYIASHEFTSGAGNPGHPLLLYRYGYQPTGQLFALDSGFPAQIGDASTETLVIAQDSTKTLWAVWMRGLRVWMAHSTSDDRTWSTPVLLPVPQGDVTSDDICSIVAFGGDRVGVMWSDDVLDAFHFTVHLDGDPDTSWSTLEDALAGPLIADDHINLKAVSDGRVLAAVKTGTDEVRVLERQPAGGWSSFLVSTAPELWTRPILLVDEEAHEAHVFATYPGPTGSIQEKVADLDTLLFPAGIGTTVMQSLDSPSLNDATTTKQSVSSATGLVVLAAQQVGKRYWHHHDDLGGPLPAAPVAAFALDTVQGFAPLSVQFLDHSSGIPDTWSWDFGDGDVSSERHPRHTYALPGSYTVSLTASNGLGSDSLTLPDAVVVTAAPTALTLTAIQDAQVRQASPDSNYGTLTTLRVRQDPSSDYHSFVKFLVPASQNQVVQATLRLWVEDGGPDGGTVNKVANTWNEALLTWNNAPPLATPLGSFGPVAPGTWVELDVTAGVSGSGLVSFGIENASSNSIFYSSREGSHAPELALVLAPPAAPTAGFEGAPLFGTPPLTVQFFDASSGAPQTFLWDFGDGATSGLQNPSHVYTRPGQYTVSLTVTGPGGSDDEAKTEYVNVWRHISRHDRP